jgi:hypothetical protein
LSGLQLCVFSVPLTSKHSGRSSCCTVRISILTRETLASVEGALSLVLRAIVRFRLSFLRRPSHFCDRTLVVSLLCLCIVF